MEIITGVAMFILLVLIFIQRSVIIVLQKEKKKLIAERNELIQKENYLLKAMNDAMTVTEPKGFMAQRMRMAKFKPINEKRIERDLPDEKK